MNGQTDVPAIDANNVGVTYPTRSGVPLAAIEDVSLTVPAGQFVSLLGPSGCGKSTFLHCLGGLVSPTAGEVQLGGHGIGKPDPRAAAFVFQEYSLLPWKKVLQNIAIGLRFAKQPRSYQRDRASEVLEIVGLSDFADSYPDELSGGMQQRVAVARALAMDPDILLMDEPFGALDEQTRRSLGVDMANLLSAQGKTIVMVTHSLDEAVFWGDRVVVMTGRPGHIAKELAVGRQRPRDPGYMMTSEFGELRAQLLELLEAPSGRAAARAEAPEGA